MFMVIIFHYLGELMEEMKMETRVEDRLPDQEKSLYSEIVYTRFARYSALIRIE
jgi:hypothetical protein